MNLSRYLNHFLIFSIFLVMLLTSCQDKRIGFVCDDGWISYSKGGPGTCSHHGGISHELYESDLK